MKKKLENIVPDIYKALVPLTKGEGLDISEEMIDSFGEDMKAAMRDWVKKQPKTKDSLRMSNIGKPLRQLWYDMKSEGEETQKLDPHLFIRFLYVPFLNLIDQWQMILIFLSIASMLFGAVAAIGQTNLKRLVGINANVHNLSSEDLDAILVNRKYNIPRLEKLLQKFNDVTFNLDSKSINAAKALVKLLNREKSVKNLCLGSFNHKTIEYIRNSLKMPLF